jgi:hypothetical protein
MYPISEPPEGTTVPDFLDVKLKEIRDRLSELKPAVDEYHRLEAAATALEGMNGKAAPHRRGPGRPRGSRSATTTRRRTRRGGNTRATQALELVRSRPGITIPEMAEAMGIKQNYLYRVLPGLEADKQVKKQGRGWHAA